MTSFARLFRKYRLKSGIETLSCFGDLLAEEGFVYETSLYTRWQQGDRIPKNRKILLAIIKIFLLKKGIVSISEINSFFESAGQGYVTQQEERQILHLIKTI